MSNDFNLPLLAQQDKALELKVENADKKDIKNFFNFNQRLGPCSSRSKKSLQYLPSIFDRHGF